MVSTYTHRMRSEKEVIKLKKVFTFISFCNLLKISVSSEIFNKQTKQQQQKRTTNDFLIVEEIAEVILANYIVIKLNVILFFFVFIE